MNKLINWFKQSNRYKHLLYGLYIFIFYFIISSLLLLTCSNIAIISVISSLAVITHMITAEYKDKQYGNKFDWLDILAGSIVIVLLPLVIYLYELLQN